ncbi:HutD family protein [Wukongibacter baidiensis]|uniref:HutD/Ves family protein n=1 Tax=Wukongibacter baidiensis TaxID=1723361 RepID=UPI003D7FF12E
MAYEIELIKKNQLKTNNWSGGTTTQLAIHPKDAIYSERNFKWRLSSAKVDVDESDFTSLPGIDRIIMIIEGQLKLEHEGHHKSVLNPFDQDSFSGSWKTKSYGRVIDFNLMTSEDCDGSLEAIHLLKGKTKKITFDKEIDKFLKETQAIYCVDGQTRVDIANNESFRLNKGDIILITSEHNFNHRDFKVHNDGDTQSKLIKATIRY